MKHTVATGCLIHDRNVVSGGRQLPTCEEVIGPKIRLASVTSSATGDDVSNDDEVVSVLANVTTAVKKYQCASDCISAPVRFVVIACSPYARNVSV